MYVNIKKICWALWIITSLLPYPALAANGVPDSNHFGYGVRVDLQGTDPLTAIQTAGQFNLDWIALDFDWQTWQAEAQTPPDWAALDAAMALAAKNQLGVLISIIRPPAWAMSPDGPNADKTGTLVSSLVQRYGNGLLAIEIFPGANTVQGWGGAPNPKAYTHLLKTVSQAVRALSSEIWIVGAGLTPVASPAEGLDDLDFLRQIYAAGIAEFMPLLGLRLPAIGNDPLARAPQTRGLTLRHYENIRHIMLENGHRTGLIWVTGFSWDANAITTPQTQANWVKQAYLLFRSQLYIGAAFFAGFNPSQAHAPELLQANGGYHPGFAELAQIIAQDRKEQTITLSTGIVKKISNKNYRKAGKP